ncbi:MAG: hypothetical protein GY705_29850, partial [Bacteroidetes bacterium]|nr:hypothetical protein [Bacteroidota bacterium]
MKKKLLTVLFLSGAILIANNSFAGSFTINDTPDTNGSAASNGGWDNWNNQDWTDQNENLKNKDQNGTPRIQEMTVEYNENTRILEKVIISMVDINERQQYDALFINTDYTGLGDLTWDSWDYYVIDGLPTNHQHNTGVEPPEDGFYEVLNFTDQYSYATKNSARKGK